MVEALGRYEILEEIGQGGFAIVYRARDTELNRQVALKELRPTLLHDTEWVKRFKREAQTIAHLDHPRIVTVFDVVEVAARLFIVMRLVDGPSLDHLLASQGPLPWSQVVKTVSLLAAGLDYAHAQGFLHRDLKPANILLDSKRGPLLSDFGLAKLVSDHSMSQSGSIVGTPHYIAPEVWDGQGNLPQSDIYALGCILYEMLTGEKAIQGESPPAVMMAHFSPLTLPETWPEGVPAGVAEVLRTAMARQPGDRYATAGDMAAALTTLDEPGKLLKPNRGSTEKDLPTSLPFKLEKRPIDEQPRLFVAREPEMAQLNKFLDQALAGRGGVVFVMGEAGQGKTSLVEAFTRQAQARHTDLIIASGTCDAYTGVGDPYLPFREILAMLNGDLETRWAAGTMSYDQAQGLWTFIPQVIQALVTSGPDLLDIFISASAVLKQAQLVVPPGADWLSRLKQLTAQPPESPERSHLNQANLFQQYSQVMLTLAQTRPLLLVLDDLQWADAGSINLLFHLGRRLKGNRLLIVGAYRPADVALGRRSTLASADGQVERHPLEAVVNEFRREFGQNQVDLSQAEGRPLVEALLDSEPNRLSQAFREALYRHTQGHALFTVEMLRGLQGRGDLGQDEAGYWVERGPIQWGQLPARVEGIIGERIGRLPAGLHEMLKVASVMGEEFTAEVVAWVLKGDEREAIRQLSGVLDKQHHLVRSQGGQRLASQRLSHYRFQHILLQYYLYQTIDEVERAYLHEDVGNALEQLYAGQTETVAVQLARHFREAGLIDKALGYLQQAGEQAARRSANQEAVRLFNDALTLLKTFPEAPERRSQELRLQLALARAQWRAGQIAEAMATFQRSADIARALKLPEELARAALGFENVRYRFNLPAEPAVRLLEEAQIALGEEDSVLKARVLANLARALLSTGSPERLEALSEQAIEMARHLNDPRALLDALESRLFAHRRPEKIEARIATVEEMLRLAQEMGDQEVIQDTYVGRILEYLEIGDIQSVDADLDAGVLLAEKLPHTFLMYIIRVQEAMRAILAGRFAEGERLAQQALDAGQQMQIENVDGTFGIQMFTIRREQGGLRELAPVIKSFVERQPAASTWRPGLALVYSDLGLGPEARVQFELLAANDFAGLPQDALWVGSMAYLSEVCAFLGDAARAAILYRLLLPYAGHNVVVGYAVACYGAASRYLGLLAATMSRWTEAEQHFKEAVRMNARMEARPWLAHTQYQYAVMLLARGQAEDHDQAMSLLEEALATANELGMKFLAEKAEGLKQ